MSNRTTFETINIDDFNHDPINQERVKSYPPELVGRFNSFIVTAFDDSMTVEMQIRTLIKWIKENIDVTMSALDNMEAFKQDSMLFQNHVKDTLVNLINQFTDKFDDNLKAETLEILNQWFVDGVLSDLVRNAINEEVFNARGGKDSLSQRLDVYDLNLDTRDINVKTLGAIGDGKTDDTLKIQEAFDLAKKYNIGSNKIGGTTYYFSNGKVKIPPGIYGISETINVPFGIDVDMEGAVFIGLNQESRITCFNIVGNSYRNRYYGGTFVGFESAVKLSTLNRNTSNILFDGIVIQNCTHGIDTIDFESSRSTLLTINNFESIKTDKFLKTYTDMTILSDGWLDHTGYDGAVIENYGFLKMSNIICVPSPTQTGARPRYIDNYGISSLQPGERGLNIEHCRFGGEAGSCPIVFNYAKYDDSYSGGYGANRIVIDDATIFSSGATYGDSSAIVLFDIPNRISITNSSGISNLTKGLISIDSTFDINSIPNTKDISIYIDSSSKGSPNFPLLDARLERFLHMEDNPYSAFKRTFKTGGTYKRFKSVTTNNTFAKFTIGVDTLSEIISGVQQRDTGFAFIAVCSSSLLGSFAYKANSSYLITMSTGLIEGVPTKRLNYTLLASHGGGSNFAYEASINSIHWGTGDTGNVDSPISLGVDKITMTFKGGTNSMLTILPLWGIDNYS